MSGRKRNVNKRDQTNIDTPPMEHYVYNNDKTARRTRRHANYEGDVFGSIYLHTWEIIMLAILFYIATFYLIWVIFLNSNGVLYPEMTTRARRVGDAYETERKLEKRYESEDASGTPVRIVEWLNRTLQGVCEPCRETDWKSLQTYLKDGVALCRLVNHLSEHAGLPKISFRAKANIVFVQLANVEKFLEAAREYGIPSTCLFEPTDCCEGRKGPLVHVLDCLDRLGTLANERGFQPHYEVLKPPLADWALEDQ